MGATVQTLVEMVYAAACDPAQWPPLLEALSAALRGSGADLVMFDTRRPLVQVQFGVGLIDDEFRREYLAGYVRCDPWILRAQAKGLFRTGTVGIGESLISQSELERTEFYNEFGKRYDYTGGISGIIEAGEGTGAAISVCRRKNQSFGEEEARLLHALMPHLQRALQVHARLAEADARACGMAAALNRIETGAILVGEGSVVVFVNDAANAILADADGLTIDRGALRAARSQDTAALRSLIAGAVEAGAGTGQSPGGALALGRPSGKRSLHLTVSPCAPPPDALMSAQVRAIVFITDRERPREPDLNGVKRLYGFSRREAEIALLLVQDNTVSEIGERLGIQANSVRFHLKQLFAKTATRRQTELVSLLLSTAQLRSSRGDTRLPDGRR